MPKWPLSNLGKLLAESNKSRNILLEEVLELISDGKVVVEVLVGNAEFCKPEEIVELGVVWLKEGCWFIWVAGAVLEPAPNEKPVDGAFCAAGLDPKRDICDGKMEVRYAADRCVVRGKCVEKQRPFHHFAVVLVRLPAAKNWYIRDGREPFQFFSLTLSKSNPSH